MAEADTQSTEDKLWETGGISESSEKKFGSRKYDLMHFSYIKCLQNYNSPFYVKVTIFFS